MDRGRGRLRTSRLHRPVSDQPTERVRLLGWRWPPPQAMFLRQAIDAVALYLEPVTGGDRAELTRIGRPGGLLEELDHLLEVLLEACGRDHLEDARRLIPGIPEGMPLASWLEDQVARFPVDDLTVEERTYSSLNNEAVLVLATVSM